MNKEQEIAYQWALNQNYQSVAARYARVLAEYIRYNQGAEKMIEAIERLYPNWHKFRGLAEAVQRHAETQDAVIQNLRADNDRLRFMVCTCSDSEINRECPYHQQDQ